MSSGPVMPPLMDDDESDWFYGTDAGGHIFGFGKHKDQKLHEVPTAYLDWCEAKFERNWSNQSFFEALQKYKEGLASYAETDFGEVYVPFGKYKDKRIREYPTFFEAVRKWLQNPRRQEVHRDLGEPTGLGQYHSSDEEYASENDGDYEESDFEQCSSLAEAQNDDDTDSEDAIQSHHDDLTNESNTNEDAECEDGQDTSDENDEDEEDENYERSRRKVANGDVNFLSFSPLSCR
ncbi:hypothetical protein D9619_005530 [Psilocybe cf. subviscida]|uniref:Uncharacterized protein n=1 Tax=Psilocybe cf. subviscida TaxID=2480587 RepID=A0A8H5BWG7_9AGAR|nr:hypothetical protein D9619_005530 [Psilocybe cf. subviscida]